MGRNAAAVYQVYDVDELKQRLIDIWHGSEQHVINDAGDKWRKRLCVGILFLFIIFQFTIRVKVGNFEQKF